jgi:hypothetical protein
MHAVKLCEFISRVLMNSETIGAVIIGMNCEQLHIISFYVPCNLQFIISLPPVLLYLPLLCVTCVAPNYFDRI